jgi:hypothetical protein
MAAYNTNANANDMLDIPFGCSLFDALKGTQIPDELRELLDLLRQFQTMLETYECYELVAYIDSFYLVEDMTAKKVFAFINNILNIAPSEVSAELNNIFVELVRGDQERHDNHIQSPPLLAPMAQLAPVSDKSQKLFEEIFDLSAKIDEKLLEDNEDEKLFQLLDARDKIDDLLDNPNIDNIQVSDLEFLLKKFSNIVQ